MDVSPVSAISYVKDLSCDILEQPELFLVGTWFPGRQVGSSLVNPFGVAFGAKETFSKKAEWGEDAHNWGALSKASFDPSEEVRN